MSNEKRCCFRSLCIWVGISLVAASLVLLAWWQIRLYTAEKQSLVYTETIRGLIPELVDAVPEDFHNTSMPVLSFDGTDFVGIVELPEHNAAFPVCSTWGKIQKFPCRYQGSVYDGSMKIGGTSQKGQFDFYREISVSDRVQFIDMTGYRYTYRVSDIVYRSHAELDDFHTGEIGLVLFINNIFDFEYILIFCEPG